MVNSDIRIVIPAESGRRTLCHDWFESLLKKMPAKIPLTAAQSFDRKEFI